MTTDIATETIAPSATAWIPTAMTFGARLALVRHQMGWNLKEAARECGQPAATWRLWEMDGSQPRDKVGVSRLIASRSGCDYLWLVHGDDRGGADSPDTRTTVVYSPGQHVVATAGEERPGHHVIHHHVPGRAVRRTEPRGFAFSAN